jgi:hypothetical protein
MKRFVLIIVVLLSSCIVMSACSKKITNDNQLDTLLLMQSAIDNQDNQKFKELLLDSKRSVFTEKDLANLKEIGATGGGRISMYFMRQYSNGKMVLFNMTQREVNGKYYIQDIIEVPEEMQKFFKGKIEK